MKKKILVVDDDRAVRATFESLLSEGGYGVAIAEDYREALARLDDTNFDLIFADIFLGDKTGIDLLREVRKRGLSSPVVMITGDPSIETASEALRLGAFDYIPKPVRQQALLHVSGMALQHKALSDEREQYRSNLEAIFRSVKDAIITVDEELRVLEVNEAAQNLCGFSRDTIGKAFASLPKGCGGRCLDAMEETLQKKHPIELSRVECQHKRRPGQVVTLTTSPLLKGQGLFAGAVIVVRDETHLVRLERDLRQRQQFHHIVGKSEKMQRIYSLIEDLADVSATVLITGESGTGKELVAEALHYKGGRSRKPLVKVNCSALSENLLESELFGHVKGAFTGAVKDRAGRFQRAHGGTLFLDEIGEISPRIQLRLLRVLQEKEFERVGDSTPIQVDVRVVAATNRDLREKVRLGEFREDLYYRLNVVEVALPPLRERREDIPLLGDHFLKRLNERSSKGVAAISQDVLKIFMDYPWPGNIRELEHTLEHAFILCRQSVITLDDLPSHFRNFNGTKVPSPKAVGADHPQAILQALEKTGWNKSKAARLLGISRRTIYRKIEEHKIVKDREYPDR